MILGHRRAAFVMATLVVAVAVGDARAAPEASPVVGRWYAADQVRRGELIYAASCARCHGGRAEGAPGWREPLPTGYLRPPPLDASGHAWEHRFEELVDIVSEGGAATSGIMPPFRETLAEGDQHAVIAWFQSLWPDAVYQTWLQAPGCTVPAVPESAPAP